MEYPAPAIPGGQGVAEGDEDVPAAIVRQEELEVGVFLAKDALNAAEQAGIGVWNAL